MLDNDFHVFFLGRPVAVVDQIPEQEVLSEAEVDEPSPGQENLFEKIESPFQPFDDPFADPERFFAGFLGDRERRGRRQVAKPSVAGNGKRNFILPDVEFILNPLVDHVPDLLLNRDHARAPR